MQNLFKEYEGIFGEKEEIELEEKKERVFGYKPFALQDAIGEKSAKKAWIEYQKLRFTGIEAEDIIHKVISKVKDIAAIKMGASKSDLGIQKDYPYNKSKMDTGNWKKEELKSLYTNLVKIYHQSRMGGGELDTAVERILLNV